MSADFGCGWDNISVPAASAIAAAPDGVLGAQGLAQAVVLHHTVLEDATVVFSRAAA